MRNRPFGMASGGIVSLFLPIFETERSFLFMESEVKDEQQQ